MSDAVPPGEEPPPERDLWPWLAALLILVLGGLGAAYVLGRDDEDDTEMAIVTATTTTDRRLSVPEPTTNETTTVRTTTERSTTSEEQTVAVPRVVGLGTDAAEDRLREAQLAAQVREVFAERAAGVVVRQRPRPEQEVPAGTRVLLEVSKGPSLVAVPSVVGASEADAGARLDAAGFTIVVYDVPSTEAKGTVVAQEPAAGGQAPRGSRVRINVSTGAQQGEETERPATPTVTVPDLVGMKRKQAVESIRRAGLQPDVLYVPSDEVPERVVAQSPRPGKTVKRGSGVRVNVSKGRNPQPDVSVPGVVGKDEQTATAELEAAGFTVEILQQDVEDPSEDGIVLDQLPGAGSRAPQGAVVTLVVGFLASG